MVITIRGHEELFFDFHNANPRDDLVVTLVIHLEQLRNEAIGMDEDNNAVAVEEYNALKEVSLKSDYQSFKLTDKLKMTCKVLIEWKVGVLIFF